MKFALIPFELKDFQDNYFYKINKQGEKIFASNAISEFWQYFYDREDEIHTIDLYKELGEVDFFLIFSLDWIWIWKIVREGYANRMIYCNAEPPTVISLNCPKGFKRLKSIFPYILTWNNDWIDNERIFIRNIPYEFRCDFGDIPYENRRLLTAITANKKSNYKDELYSEREKAYCYFEKKFPMDFTFYGVGWSKKRHPGYGGCVTDKFEIYHKYRFALCLENTKNIKDYVTEKIFDCLCSGIVPIYGGATNIKEYVPQECYIDYFEFKNLDDLSLFISQMDKETYQKYLDAAQDFLRTDMQKKYSRERYAENIYNVTKKCFPFHISLIGKMYVTCMCLKEYIVKKRRNLKKWIKQKYPKRKSIL